MLSEDYVLLQFVLTPVGGHCCCGGVWNLRLELQETAENIVQECAYAASTHEHFLDHQ